MPRLSRITKVVIPAAGLGTRFLPATKSMPKEMMPVIDRPVIQYVVAEALSAGLEDILIITGRGKRALEDHFDRSPDIDDILAAQSGDGNLAADELTDIMERANIHYVRQQKQLGLGDAIYTARRFVKDEPFVVLLGDCIFLSNSRETVAQQLIRGFEKKQAPILLVEKVEPERIVRYGVVDIVGRKGPLHRVRDLIEKPSLSDAPSDLGIVGAYALTPDIFAEIEKTKPGRNEEIQLTDAIKTLAKKRAVYALEYDGTVVDVGTREDWLKANLLLALRQRRYRIGLRRVLKDAEDMQLW